MKKRIIQCIGVSLLAAGLMSCSSKTAITSIENNPIKQNTVSDTDKHRITDDILKQLKKKYPSQYQHSCYRLYIRPLHAEKLKSKDLKVLYQQMHKVLLNKPFNVIDFGIRESFLKSDNKKAYNTLLHVEIYTSKDKPCNPEVFDTICSGHSNLSKDAFCGTLYLEIEKQNNHVYQP
jgi:hypothetical protein